MLLDSLEEYKDLIMQETLALTIGKELTDNMFSKSIEIYGKSATVYLVKQ
jgi:hypothetical protein